MPPLYYSECSIVLHQCWTSSTPVLNFKAKTEMKDRAKTTPVTGPEEKMNKRSPRWVVTWVFITVRGVNLKHTGLVVVAIGSDMYGCWSPFCGYLWNKSWVRCHLRVYLKSTALCWEDALILAVSKYNSPTFWGWTQKAYVAFVSLAISQRWVWELQAGCYPSDVPAWSSWPDMCAACI